jgi:hypothetical protein
LSRSDELEAGTGSWDWKLGLKAGIGSWDWMVVGLMISRRWGELMASYIVVEQHMPPLQFGARRDEVRLLRM